MSKNYKELTEGEVGPARKKAIKTLAKRKGMTLKQAREYQAQIIVKAKAKKD